MTSSGFAVRTRADEADTGFRPLPEAGLQSCPPCAACPALPGLAAGLPEAFAGLGAAAGLGTEADLAPAAGLRPAAGRAPRDGRDEFAAAPVTMPTSTFTMSFSSLAWADNSSEAEADSSALAALDWVSLSISVTAVPICSMPLACSWLALETSPIRWPSLPTQSTMRTRLPATSCETATPLSEFFCDCSISEEVVL